MTFRIVQPCPRCGGVTVQRVMPEIATAECQGCGGLTITPEWALTPARRAAVTPSPAEQERILAEMLAEREASIRGRASRYQMGQAERMAS